MIDAYLAGIPGKAASLSPMAPRWRRSDWNPKKNQYFPNTTVPGTQTDVDFMVKDSKRFADSGGWGWVVFKMTPRPIRSRPAHLADSRRRRTTAEPRLRVATDSAHD